MSINTQEDSTPVQEQTKSDKEYNFAQIRKQLEQEKSARIQAEERAAEYERQASSKYKAEESDDEDDSEPYVDNRRLEKKFSKFEQKMEQRIEQKAEMKARAMIDEERNSNYLRENHDFNEIMTSENVERFASKHPGLAKSILNMPDSFERQKLVYENIKALSVHKPEVKSSIQDKIDANKRSPYYQPSGVASAPYSSVGDFSPAGQKNAYDKLQQLKAQLRL